MESKLLAIPRHHSGRGIAIRLIDGLGSGYAAQMLPGNVGGKDIPLDWCRFSNNGGNGGPRRFELVSLQEPFTRPLHRDTEIWVDHVSLDREPQTIGLGFLVPGSGDPRFDFADKVSGPRAGRAAP